MTEHELTEKIDALLRPLGSERADGGVSERPSLVLAATWGRRVRLSRWPWIGRGQSVVALVKQPFDLIGPGATLGTLRRAAEVVSGLYPPNRGLSIGLTVLVLSDQPIVPDEEATLADALRSAGTTRQRAVPLGLFRINVRQGAMALTLAQGPDGLFPEPQALADGLCESLGQFVPRINLSNP